MKLCYLPLLLCFAAALHSCQSGARKQVADRMQEKFDWSPTAGSAYLYPMEIYSCDLIFADGTKIGPVVRTVATPWGEDGGTASIGDDLKPVPVILDICWLSYTENKFYRGRFQLPYAKLLQQFKNGFEDYTWTSDTERHLAHHSYDFITVGMAPGGVVVLWLSGSGEQVEAGRFQAKGTTVNMADFLARDNIVMSKDAYVKDELSRLKKVTDNLAKNGIPYGLWDTYRERFNFRPAIRFEQPQTIKINDCSLEYFNGEKDNLLDDRVIKAPFSSKARVKEMRAVWTATAAGKRMGYVLDIAFDEAEIFKAYKAVYGDTPKQAAELVIEVNKNNSSYQVFLQSPQQKIALLKQQGEIYYDDSINKK